VGNVSSAQLDRKDQPEPEVDRVVMERMARLERQGRLANKDLLAR